MNAIAPEKTNSYWAGIDFDSSPYPPPPKIPENSIAQLFFNTAKAQGPAVFAQTRTGGEKTWSTHSWYQIAAQVAALSSWLKNSLGVRPEESVGILSATRLEWVIADLAILSCQAVSIPLYQTLAPAEIAHIIRDTKLRFIFAENEEQTAKLVELENNPQPLPQTELFPAEQRSLRLARVITFESVSMPQFNERCLTFSQAIGVIDSSTILSTIELYQRLTAAFNRSDLASIVYTSGTTGYAKGVIQTNANHLAMLDSLILSGLACSGRQLFMLLPLAHSFARLVCYAAIALGGNLIFPTIVDRKSSRFDATQIFCDAHDSQAALFPAVPRLFEKVRIRLLNPPGRSIKSRLVLWAIHRELSRLDAGVQSPKCALHLLRGKVLGLLAKFVIKRVVTALFGPKLIYAVSGGAPLPRQVLDFFSALGVQILEGYGLTETCPALTANTKKYYRPGTVGRPFPGVHLRINPVDGEIECRGDNVFSGYHNLPEESRLAFTADGWFKTGDIGRIDEDGFLTITGRKKEIIITAGGKNIAPVGIELAYQRSPYISQAVVAGDGRPFIVALFTVNEEALRDHFTAIGSALSAASALELAQSAESYQLIQAEIDYINKQLAQHEQAKRFLILPEEFSLANGLLTSTLKVRRSLVLSRFRNQIEELYHN